MKTRLGYLLVALGLAAGPTAARGDDEGRVREAVRALDRLLADRVLVAQYKATVERDAAVVGREVGKVVYARHGRAALSDLSVNRTAQRSERDNRLLPDKQRSVQHYMGSGKRCLVVEYDGRDRRLKDVSFDARKSYEASLTALAGNVHLRGLVAEFEPTGERLATLVDAGPLACRAAPGGSVVATRRLRFGELAVTVQRVGGRDHVSAAEFVQGPADVYTHLSGEETLADVRSSVLGGTPDGLSRVVSRYTFSYGQGAADWPVTVVTFEQQYAAGPRSWRATRSMAVTENRSCSGEGDLDRFKIAIPDGVTVNSVDPNFKPLSLVLDKGEVVRQVDGASLERVVAAGRRRGWVYSLVLCAAVLAAGGGAVVYARRHCRPAQGGAS